MARVGISKTKTFFSRQLQPVGRSMSTTRPGGVDNLKKGSSIGSRSEGDEDSSSCLWVPHPRTGIYFPLGHESVMEDVPTEAASFKQIYWLRSVDGVDKPNPDDGQYSTDFHFDIKL